MERGVIAFPGIVVPRANGFLLKRTLSVEEIRFYLMYWSRIVIPSSNHVNIGVPDEEDLIAFQAIERPRVHFSEAFRGNMMAHALLSSQEKVASELLADKATDWVMHQFGESLSFLDSDAVERNVLRIDLLNTLPVPIADAPISEILEFKLRRAPELLQLHDALDSIYFSVLSSPDQDLASRKELASLRQAIASLERVQKERFKFTRKFDHSIEFGFDVSRLGTAVAAGAAYDLVSGYIVPVGALLGGVGSLVKLSFKASYSIDATKDKQKLAYLGRAASEGYIQL